MTPAEITAAVDARLIALRDSLGPHLRPGFEAMVARRGWLTGDPERYLDPASQPVIGLPLAVGRALGMDDATLLDAFESSMVGYAAVRIHDDWLDEGIGDEDPHATALLAHALAARHQAATARVAGDHPAFWDLFATTWADYGEAMVLERDLLRGPDGGAGPYDAPAFERVLLRSRPLVLPPAALLARGGAWDRLPALVALVAAVTRASQLLDDTLDVLEELDAGRMNHLVQRFGGLHGRKALLVGWALGGFASAMEEADSALTEAEAAAGDLGIGEAVAQFARGRRDLMTRIRAAALPPG